MVSKRCCVSPGLMRSGEYPTREVAAGLEARCLLEHRNAVFLGGAGIDRRLVDDDRSFAHRLADGLRGFAQCAEVGPPRIVDRGRHRHDEEVGALELGRVGRELYAGWRKSAAATSRVRSCPALSSRTRSASMSKPITGAPSAAEGDRHGKSHIAEPDDRDLASVRHLRPTQSQYHQL